MAINSPTRARRVSYPYTDGKPMGESDLHVRLMLDLLFTLRWFLNNVRACVAANMFIYYEEGNPKRVICPDLFVVLGAHPESRMSYQVWNEGGLVPDLVIELTSKSTRKVDQEQKPALYAQLGVQEYILFDPLGHYLRPRLKGFRLKSGAYQPMDDFPIHSERLGLEFRVEDQALRLYDMESGERLPTADEDHLARRSAEVARHLAEVRPRRRGGRPRRRGGRPRRRGGRPRRCGRGRTCPAAGGAAGAAGGMRRGPRPAQATRPPALPGEDGCDEILTAHLARPTAGWACRSRRRGV
jgi:Uma2 family endonuclease